MSRTVPNNPANALTPSYSTVSSPAGFQSGDLVYYKDSSFGTIPGNAVSSANFPISATVNQNQMAFNTTVNYANYNPDTQTGSTNNRAPSSALLTNGNIVVVYGEHGPSSGDGFFKIIDQDGNIIVNRTLVSSNIQNMGVIGVAALTGGGFAVALKGQGGGSGYMRYGVYSNTGTVVTAMADDTNFGTSFDTFDIKPLSGGGFAIALQQSSSTWGFRSYSSTGVGTPYITASGWSSTGAVVITTFSDNSYAALYPSASTSLKITRFSSTGAYVADYTAASGDWYNQSGFDFITLSTGVAVILYVENGTSVYYTYGKTYDQSTGAVSGATTFNGAPYSQSINAKALSAGGFLMTSQEYYSGMMRLYKINASFGVTSFVSLLGLAAYCQNNQAGRNQNTTIIEGSTYLTVVDNSYNTTSYSFHNLPYIQIDKNNFTASGIRKRFSTTSTVGQVSAAVSGYARSNSTPNSAAFLATTTQTLTQAVPASSGTTFALTPFAAIGDTVRTQSMTVMTNGQFVIAYGTQSGAVKFTVFNPDGSVVSTTTVASSGALALVRCTCLGNGKLVVSWVTSSNNSVSFSVYSSAYTLLTTAVQTNIAGNSIQSPGSQDSSPGHDIAPFGNDFFVLATANGGSNIFASVFNDSAVYQNNSTASLSSSLYNIRIASNASGDVAIKTYAAGSGVGYLCWFARNTANNTIFNYSNYNMSVYGTQNYGEGMAISPYGSTMSFTNNGGPRYLYRGMATSGYNTAGIGSVSFNSACVCVGQNGEFVTLQIDNSNQVWRRYSVNASTGNYGSAVGQGYIDEGVITISDYNTTGSVGSMPQMVNIYDNIYAFSYITSSSTIKVGLLNAVAASYSTVITAGVTPSNTALIPAPSNGYYFAGVSASDCSAGGTGVLQVNGVAALSSQYPAGTASQAFDFTAPALDVGVRGTIAGRNVIISGAK
jgi:hypothetical protein